MILWYIVGFIVWALCILFMLSIFKGGNQTRRHEQKLHYRHMVVTGKGEDLIKSWESGLFSFAWLK